MREINFSKKTYYTVVWIIIAIMISGVFVDNPRIGKLEVGYITHCILVVILSICLLLYPKKSTNFLRITIIIVASIFFYTLFIFYPETFSTFIFLCLIPALSILYFDSRLFYFSLVFNFVSTTFIFLFIMVLDKGHLYPHIEQDLIGNFANFIVSQIIIYFIFYLMNVRIKKLQLYYEQIQQSERLKTTGQLSAAVAHEIRNPLTVVSGFLQLFKQDSTLSEEQKGHCTLMINELNTAEQVISQFLTLAKPDKEKVTEAVDVKLILQSVTDLLHSYGHIHDKSIELNVNGDCRISANHIEIKQLLINIIKNAIEASKMGDIIQVIAESEKNFVVIKVIDHGCGMTEEEIATLGTPFYSLKSKGTGLGMMICFSIVKKYKGKIEFQSSKGEGTTVTVRIPSI
ncbi:two-component system sporulation sensor kinase B [Bacillus mesophilus]|uniref:histidine kinase n=1 Tax=Bacillus mesophilus TaxID=1808955 RepID=A0A6M0Q9N7_9BACI|nr:HAMP domain-containing sensor histidine kinase [Bacillus mesophilus]MBM7662292.1 two-component system sporulation sensor kinase B [Bacillus mesophilus]NEY73074.1 HAMP domain-containing histidine kinase [Bacillus mesophilus]